MRGFLLVAVLSFWLSGVSHAETQTQGAGVEPPAGEIFGMPVSLGNYGFAKRVALTYPAPWGASDLPPERLEPFIWEQLILHYESFRRSVVVPEERVEEMIQSLLKNQNVSWTRRSDPEAYRRWVSETLKADVPLFENQIRYLLAIRLLTDKILEEANVTVSEEEMKEEFLNEKNHVGGEMVVFHTREEASDFYERFKDPSRWEEMKAKGDPPVRSVSLMTLEAYMDLWSIPKGQMVAFHALELGKIGPPMPFGKDWCVYRLLDKRTGDLSDFPKERESYRKQVEMKKKYEAQKQWLERLKEAANLKIFLSAEKS